MFLELTLILTFISGSILADKREVTKSCVYYFIKLNNIFFLHIVWVIYVVLGWVCQIWTKFSEAKLWHVTLNGFTLARYLSFVVLWKPKMVVVEWERSKPANLMHQQFRRWIYITSMSSLSVSDVSMSNSMIYNLQFQGIRCSDGSIRDIYVILVGIGFVLVKLWFMIYNSRASDVQTAVFVTYMSSLSVSGLSLSNSDLWFTIPGHQMFRRQYSWHICHPCRYRVCPCQTLWFTI